MKKFLVLIGIVLSFLLIFPTVSMADNILITEYEHTGYADMKANLESFGHTVDIIDATIGGNIASALAAESYDQLFLWDLTSTAYVNAVDLSAMGAFFGDHSSLVVDSRSYGYHFQPNQASEVALLGNIAEEFSLRGGGVWVGSDHDPMWTRNSNQFLAEIGIGLITGSHSEAVNDWDPSSVLLDGVIPTDLWGEFASIGTAPLGIQANGMDMRFHFGHYSEASGAIPYITASFGDYSPVPEPATMILLGTGLLGLAALRRKIIK